MTDKSTEDRRADDRRTIEGALTVRVDPCEIHGPSQNVSADGVYFTAQADITVEVELPNGTRRRGKILRVGAVRDGELGVAVRFDEALSGDDLS